MIMPRHPNSAIALVPIPVALRAHSVAILAQMLTRPTAEVVAEEAAR